MPKVLFVDQYSELGGGQRILLDIVHHFSARDVCCAVALPEKGVVAATLRDSGIPVFPFEVPKLSAGHKSASDVLSFLSSARSMQHALERIALDFDAQLVFCNGPRAMLPSVLACSSLDLPLIGSVHLIFHGLERLLLSWCFKRPCVKAVTFCSRAAADAFAALPAGKTAMVGNWVSPAFEQSSKVMGARASFGLRENDFAVGVVGRLSRNKGQRLLLEASAPLVRTHPNLKVVVAGGTDFEDPNEERFLRELSQELEIAEQVLFLGPVTNTVALMDCINVLVVPSLWEEPFGLVAIEGMARGLPVIATASGGLKDILIDGETGYLVEKDAYALREALTILISDPFAAEEMGERGRQRAHSIYSAAPRLDGLLQLVQSTLEGASSGMNFAA